LGKCPFSLITVWGWGAGFCHHCCPGTPEVLRGCPE
jgi:hypothetical protein